MSSEVEEVKDRLGIVDVVGEYVRLTKAGSNWKALCPFHNEKTPSFMVSEERRSFHCFGCGKGGDIFTFVMEMEGIGFREALEQLAQKAGVEIKKGIRSQELGIREKEQKSELYKILELATKWYEKNLWEGKGKEKIMEYLHDRGLLDTSIRKFRLGYAPEGWRNMLEFLQKRGYKIEEIARTGLLVERNPKSEALNLKQIQNSKFKIQNSDYYDRFRDRIMFPIQDIMGRIVGFSARVAPGGDEKIAKYINTPQTDLYDKSKTLYGLHLAKTAIKKQDSAILVEGNTDVIASHQAGFENTIAVSGTALTPEQIKALRRYTENVDMAFDMDQAGQAAAKRSARVCLENDLNVRIVLLPSGKDAAEVIRQDKSVWEKAIGDARSIVEYFFEDAFSRYDSKKPTDKKKIARELLNIIKDIASPVERSHWIRGLAEKLAVDEKMLTGILKSSGEKKNILGERKPETLGRVEKERMLEKRVLGLILAFPRETERERKKINVDDFSGLREKTIFEDITRKEHTDFEEMKKSITDYESQKFLDETVFEVEVEAEGRRSGFFDPAKELREAIGRIRQSSLKEKITKLTRDMREAEKSGDKEAVRVLMEEFQRLSDDLRK